MERVVERSNLRLAYQRVVENKGAAGVDEMLVSELKDWLTVHWPRLKINARKSAVARPWLRKFLGFSVTAQRETRLRIAKPSVQRLMQRVRELSHTGRGRSLHHTVEDLNPLLRGWINYFLLTDGKGVLADLDGWVRRRLRCLLWRQWQRPKTRARKLRALGLDAEAAWRSSGNGHGPWWNAGAGHLNHALPAAYFTRVGLVSLRHEWQRLQSVR